MSRIADDPALAALLARIDSSARQAGTLAAESDDADDAVDVHLAGVLRDATNARRLLASRGATSTAKPVYEQLRGLAKAGS